MNSTYRAVALSLILGVSLAALSPTTHADPVEWTLQNIVFEDGGTLTGTFVFDADTQTVSNINLEASAGFNFSGNTYTAALGGGSAIPCVC